MQDHETKTITLEARYVGHEVRTVTFIAVSIEREITPDHVLHGARGDTQTSLGRQWLDVTGVPADIDLGAGWTHMVRGPRMYELRSPPQRINADAVRFALSR